MGLCLGAMLTGNAWGDQKLLVTDILNGGEAELQVGYDYRYANPTLVGGGKITESRYQSTVSGGIGVAKGVELTLSVPSVFRARELGADGVESHDGLGDLTAGASFSLPSSGALALAAGLGVKFDTAGTRNAGTGGTDFIPLLAASYRLEQQVTPYLYYRPVLRGQGHPDTHSLALGAEKAFGRRFTLDGKLAADFETAAGDRTSWQEYAVDLTGYLQMFPNVYLLPNLGAFQHSRRTVGNEKEQSVAGFTGGMALYCYFP